MGASAEVELHNVVATQESVFLKAECLSLSPELASKLAIQQGRQVKIVRPSGNSSLHTVCELRTEEIEHIVRMPLEPTINTLPLVGIIDTQVSSQLSAELSRAEAEQLGGLIEISSISPGRDNPYLVLAPYGGDIALNTERQAEILSAKDGFKNTWILAGFDLDGSVNNSWRIAHDDLSEGSFPKLAELVKHVKENGVFKLGVIFDAWQRNEVVIGGSSSLLLRQEIASAIAWAMNDSTIKVVAYNAADPAHAIYNISAQKSSTLKSLSKQTLIIKQGPLARETYYKEMTNALHQVLVAHREHFDRAATDPLNVNTLSNSNRHQIIYGTNAPDTIYAGNNDNTIYGEQDNDILLGNAGDDIIYGGDDIDRIYGGQDDDLIFGGLGNDIITGGVGVDTIFVGIGDIVFGSGGNDVFVLLPGAGKYQILDLSESESVLSYQSPTEIEQMIEQIISLGGKADKESITLGLKQEMSGLNTVAMTRP
jgi:hypothetical protein